MREIVYPVRAVRNDVVDFTGRKLTDCFFGDSAFDGQRTAEIIADAMNDAEKRRCRRVLREARKVHR